MHCIGSSAVGISRCVGILAGVDEYHRQGRGRDRIASNRQYLAIFNLLLTTSVICT